MLKKFFAGTLSILLSFTLLSAQVSGLAAGKSVNETLTERGYPTAVLETLCEEAKAELVNRNCYFESAQKDLYDENGALIASYDLGQQNQRTPRGQIQASHLSLSIVISRTSTNAKNVTYNYDWKTLPVNRWQDPIGVSWDSNCFYIQGGSFHKVDKYIYYNRGVGTPITGTQSDEWAYASAYANGCTWYADLKGYSSLYDITDLYGYATFTLIPKTSGGTSQLYGKYVHNKLMTGVSLSIPGFGSISVNGGSNYDELGNQTTIVW